MNDQLATAYVALGSNLGERLQNLQQAVDRLGELGRMTAISHVYETDPVGYTEQPLFLNAVVRLETALPPAELMTALLAIEQAMGRVRTIKYGPRTLDLDLLFYDQVVMVGDHLTLPHPRLHERAFVLVPLAEIAPQLVHPRRQRTVQELLDELPETDGVRRFARLTGAIAPAGAGIGEKEQER